MSIVEEAFATQLITKDGTAYKFDDIGCMMTFLQGEKGKSLEITNLYVRDFESKEWIDPQGAYHVYHSDIVTPMAYGVVSFASKEKAQSYLQQLGGSGELYDYEKLKQHKWDEIK